MKLYKLFEGMRRRMAMPFAFLRNWRAYTDNDSYYPDEERKSRLRIFFDQLGHAIRYGEINTFYFLYGFDRKNKSDRSSYMDYYSFRDLRNRKNYRSPNGYNYICLERDKHLFTLIGKACGMPVISDLGMLREGFVEMESQERIPLLEFLDSERHLFFKPVDSECGVKIFCVDKRDGVLTLNDNPVQEDELMDFVGQLSEPYIVQKRLVQHPLINALYPNAVNTLRLTTVVDEKNDDIHLFASFFRMGTGNMVIDNWARGGVLVEVRQEGRLSDIGWYEPPHGTTTRIHPDSKVLLGDITLPYYKESVELAKKFHRAMRGIYSIGWDIAITEGGPVFIEANDNWEISAMQVYSGGMKDYFLRWFGDDIGCCK